MIQSSSMYYQAAVSRRESVVNLSENGYISSFPILYPSLSLAQVVFFMSKELQILWKTKQNNQAKQMWESIKQ